MILTNRPSESEHWYTVEGKPAYTMIGKNGQERSTTLRDAKKLGLVPSVTTILKQVAKPGLEFWKEEQILMAALTLPRRELETEKEWLYRVRMDAREHSRQASVKGMQIHAAVENHLAGQHVSAENMEYVGGAVKELEKLGSQAWHSEKSFAHPDGFGGKIDLHSDSVVLDIKTKEFGPEDLPEGYEEHMMQVAAYAYGLRMNATCGNLFVSVSNPGLAHLHIWTPDETQKGLKMFLSLLAYWKAKNLC